MAVDVDTDRFTRGSIDYSPYQPAKIIRMILSESELRGIEEYRYERFFRVWCTEKSKYAPCLTELSLLLRPSFESSPVARHPLHIHIEGIHSFLDYFNHSVANNVHDVSLKIYIDNWCETSDRHVRYSNAPQLIYDQAATSIPLCGV